MKKYQDSKVSLNTDPITNEYKITVPEWVVNEFDWYEDTELVWHIDDSGIHIQEVSDQKDGNYPYGKSKRTLYLRK